MRIPEHRTCLTTEVNSDLRERYHLPSIENFEKEFTRLKSSYLQRKKTQRTTDEVITIPVIVHVIHNGENIGTGPNISAAQVQSQIEVLNEDFRRKSGTSGFNAHTDGADVGIEFALALRDEFGNALAEPGIHRVDGNKQFWERVDLESVLKPQTIWDPTKYLNIWTVNFGGEQDGLLGYAQLPSLSGLDGLETNEGLSNTDGVVVGYKSFGRVGNLAENYNGGRTATHEVGHWLGLRHIWGDGDCTVDDYCSDTPNASGPNYGCPVAVNSCMAAASNNDASDMIENYMDYTNDACMNIFTQEQKVRMRTVMEVSPRRKELLSSKAHLSLESPIAYFNASRTNICSGESVDFTDESINNPTSREWIFLNPDSTVVGTFTDANPSLIFEGIGIYSVMLVVENTSGSDTLYSPNYITVLSSEKLSLPYEENFETANTLENWVYYNPDNDRGWQETNISSSQGGSKSIVIDNYSLDSDPSGNLDAIISPSIDLTANQNAYFTFDVAYAKYGGDYSDTLAVFISTDCGNEFVPIWSKGGDDLATASAVQEAYVPSGDSQWVTERIPLQAYNGFSNVHIALVNISGWGNNLYLDNISVLQPSYTEPSFTIFYTPRDTVSVGSTVNFWDYSTGYPTAWSWEFQGASSVTSNEQNPSVEYNTVGTFDVKLATSNASGGDEWVESRYITVIDKPNVTIASNPTSRSICEGDSITLIASGASFYEWYDNRGYLTSENDVLTAIPKVSTAYSLTGYDHYGGESSVETQVIVNSLPVFDLGEEITITEDDSVTLAVTGNFSAYLWSDNSTANALTVSGKEYGVGTHEINVTVTNAANCSSTDAVLVTVSEVTSVMELDFEDSDIKIYPIPAHDHLNIEFAKMDKDVQLYLYDVNGKLLTAKNIRSDFTQLKIGDLPQGVYLIKLVNELKTETLRIVKE